MDPIDYFNPTHFCACPKPGPRFHCPLLLSLLYIEGLCFPEEWFVHYKWLIVNHHGSNFDYRLKMLTVIKDNIDYTLTVIKNYLLSVRALYFLHTSILTVHNSLLVSSHGIDSEPYLMGA